jgi:hypothetical protein
MSYLRQANTIPTLIAQVQSFNGADPVGVRYRNLGVNSVQVLVEEERCADDDGHHNGETVGYFWITGNTFIPLWADI